ncbi:hypothetical protein B1A_03885 [mine drainage metagenome]|uniref:Uncharacterized protein n=1 Tax=mine drainage metagenome TaxID=410659 RepID=T1C200_9ZZZZ
MKGTLIVFTIPRSKKGVSPSSYSRFYRKLYGYNNSSHYGKYHKRIPGFLDNYRYVKYANGVIVTRPEASEAIVEFLKNNQAEVHKWDVEISDHEQKELEA